MNVDIHAHIIVPEVLREQNPAEAWRPHVRRDAQGTQQIEHRGRRISSTPREFVDIERILEEQRAAHVDVVVLSPWLALFNYDLSPAEAQRTCRLQSQAIVRLAKDHLGQMAGMGIVPLQDPVLAAREAEYLARELGLRAIEIGSNVNGRYLGDSSLLPFWEKIAELDMLVFIHPVAGIGGPLMREHYFWNLFGNPSETGLTAADLILSGTLERLPNLKICLAHGGGTLPYIIGRLDHGFEVRPESRANITRPPCTFLKQFYYDTITHSAEALRYLIRLVGADRVLLGSDYPFDMGVTCPSASLDGLDLSTEERALILGKTAARILGLLIP